MADLISQPPKGNVYFEAHIFDREADPEYLKVGCYAGSDVINISIHDGNSEELDQPAESHAIQVDRDTFTKAVERVKNATIRLN